MSFGFTPSGPFRTGCCQFWGCLHRGNFQLPSWEARTPRHTAVAGPAARPAAGENAALIAAAALRSRFLLPNRKLFRPAMSTWPSQTRAPATARNICALSPWPFQMSLLALCGLLPIDNPSLQNTRRQVRHRFLPEFTIHA